MSTTFSSLIALASAAVLVACTSSPAPNAPPPIALAPAGFLAGAWTSPTVTEAWSYAGTTLFGVGFTVEGTRTRSFEAMFIQVRGGKLRFTAMPGGARAVAFTEVDRAAGQIVFANPAHDFPKRVRYRREGDALAARVEDDARGVDFAYRAAPPARAPMLEEADRAFAADTASRGAEGWVSWFDREGWMWREPAGRVQGADAIRAAISKTLQGGARRLDWHPVTSGLSPARDMGFTVGEWVLSATADHRELDRGAYVSVWRLQGDGAWKVLFDTGEPG